jgi:hypothetical protein
LLGGIFVTGLFRKFSGIPSSTVAEVNGYEIGVREFQRRVSQEDYQISQIRQQFGKNAQMLLDAYGLSGSTEDRVLKSLITQKLLVWGADKMGVALSPAYVSAQLKDPAKARSLLSDIVPPNFFTPSGINYRDLLKGLARQGLSAGCVEQAVEDRLKQQIVVALASQSAYVPEALLRDAFNKAYRARKLLFIKVPLAPYLKAEQGVQVKEEVLKGFYEETKNRSRRFWKPEKRSGRSWIFDISPLPKDFVQEGEKANQQGGAAFDEFVKKHKGVLSSLPMAERSSEKLSQELFKLKPGSRAVGQLDAKDSKDNRIKGYIVELTTIEPEGLLEFPVVKAKVAEEYAKSQAARKLVEDLGVLEGLDVAKRAAWVAEHKATEKTTGFIAFNKPEEFKEIQKEGIPTNRLLDLEEKGDRITVTTPQDGYMIELVEFGPFDENLFKEKKSDLAQSLEREETGRVTLDFIASLEKNAKIKTNKSFFNRR